jgi:Sulfotransferase domain
MKNLFSTLFQNKARHNDIIIVSGLPRSGTSLMMSMLEAGGMTILTDNKRTADIDNPEGYHEYELVKDLVKGNYSWLSKARGKGVKVISTLLPYLPIQHHYRIIFMRRDMAEILASQKKMIINRGEDPDKIPETQMTQIFEKNIHQVEEWINSHPNVTKIDISYNQLLREPESLVYQVSQFVGGDLDVNKMLNVINPNLYRQRLAK